MASRLELHKTLCDILGSRNVYYQPPASVNMKYPAIRYDLQGYKKVYANAGAYRLLPSYKLTLIDTNPDSPYVARILALPYCQFDRSYPADNLNHFIFTLFN